LLLLDLQTTYKRRVSELTARKNEQDSLEKELGQRKEAEVSGFLGL